jgi:hypothetical protein
MVSLRGGVVCNFLKLIKNTEGSDTSISDPSVFISISKNYTHFAPSFASFLFAYIDTKIPAVSIVPTTKSETTTGI